MKNIEIKFTHIMFIAVILTLMGDAYYGRTPSTITMMYAVLSLLYVLIHAWKIWKKKKT